MHFVVLVAFAMVLMPLGTPPWPIVTAPFTVLAIAVGQVAAIAGWAAWATWRVLRQLDRDPTRPSMAQRMHARDGATLGTLLIVGLVLTLWGTSWPTMARRQWNLQSIYGLAEFVMLLPFFGSLSVAWTVMFPADRAIRQLSMEANLWEGLPARPPWTLGEYFVFLIRHQLLIVVLPMMLIVIANDYLQAHARYLRHITRLYWADQAVLVLIAGVILFFAPVMLRVIWSTSVLPNGPLRDRLVALSNRVGLKYREILIWHSEGMVVNAAVMGVLAPVRYVLLSDGLLERMEDEKIEAVFGHEAGHVKHLHIPYYLLFAILSMLIVGGVCELAFRVLRADPSYVTITAVTLLVAMWGLGFGWISRRFERQADVFGAHVISPDAGGCELPCHVHRHAEYSAPPEKVDQQDASFDNNSVRGPAYALCATGARAFGDALCRIARLNGIPEEARSWRHSSIGSRVRFLACLADDPKAARRFSRTVGAIKVVLVVGTIIGLAIAVRLYPSYM
jgi:STE24 endopeptidase